MKNKIAFLLSLIIVLFSFSGCSENPPQGFENGEKFTVSRISLWLPEGYEIKESVSSEEIDENNISKTAYHKNYPVVPETVSICKTKSQDKDDFDRAYFESTYGSFLQKFSLIEYEEIQKFGYDCIFAEYSGEYENLKIFQRQYLIFTEEEIYMIILSTLNKADYTELDKILETVEIKRG